MYSFVHTPASNQSARQFKAIRNAPVANEYIRILTEKLCVHFSIGSRRRNCAFIYLSEKSSTFSKCPSLKLCSHALPRTAASLNSTGRGRVCARAPLHCMFCLFAFVNNVKAFGLARAVHISRTYEVFRRFDNSWIGNDYSVQDRLSTWMHRSDFHSFFIYFSIVLLLSIRYLCYCVSSRNEFSFFPFWRKSVERRKKIWIQIWI